MTDREPTDAELVERITRALERMLPAPSPGSHDFRVDVHRMVNALGARVIELRARHNPEVCVDTMEHCERLEKRLAAVEHHADCSYNDDGTYSCVHGCPVDGYVESLEQENASLRSQLAEAEKKYASTKAAFDDGNPFREWAQSYLDAGRWAGHRLDEAIKTELLERDAQLAEARKDVERLDWLEKMATPNLPWVARESTMGRGYRLHQDLRRWASPLGTTARAAIDAARAADIRDATEEPK